MIITHNLLSMNASRQTNIVNGKKTKNIEKLSSGYRINRAADDASGLAVSEKMRGQIRGLHQAGRNIEDGVSLFQTMDGGMTEIHSILQRTRELAVQAANDINTEADRAHIQAEVDQLLCEVNRIANQTTFNGIHILNEKPPKVNVADTTITDATVMTTLLGTPNIGNNGIMKNMVATNEAGAKKSQLLFGSSSATTSGFMVNINAGGTNYPYASNGVSDSGSAIRMSAPTTALVNHPTTGVVIGATATYTITKEDPARPGTNLFEVEIIQKITKQPNPIAPPAGSGMKTGEVFNIEFEIKNNGGLPVSVDLELGLDVMFEGDDNPKFLLNGRSQEINNHVQWNGANVPGVVDIYSKTNPNLNVQCITTGAGLGIHKDPDYMKVGQWANIFGPHHSNHAIMDSMYTVGWDDETLAAGRSTKLNTFYGVSDPRLNNELMKTVTIDIIDFKRIQSGANSGQEISYHHFDCTTPNLEAEPLLMGSHEEATASITRIDKAIDKISSFRSVAGSWQNRAEHAFNNVTGYEENLQDSESKIRDTNMAEEMMKYSKENILEQAGQSVLSQANRIGQGVLSLLQ